VTADAWDEGAAYERYVGRWSRPIAAPFVDWLGLPEGGAWLDVGCGTGALSQTILARAHPRLVTGCDRSAAYATYAESQTVDHRARFVRAELSDLPAISGGFDAVVSGLVLNFLPDPVGALAAMAARVRRGGLVAAYVWDYAEGIELMRIFWDAAAELDPEARELDEGLRFPICRPRPLERAFQQSGLRKVEVRGIEVPTVFRDFDDYWAPFLGGQGPAPSYTVSLSPARRSQLREAVRSRVPVTRDGSIRLTARAWAAKGVV
jgi:SAM-dependent methyltransferase